MLTSKQRAYLRSIANNIDTILMVGKGNISDEIINQADNAINKREIIKGKVLETSALNAREVAEEIAKRVDAEVVSVIGSKFILYRKNNKEPKIVLPK